MDERPVIAAAAHPTEFELRRYADGTLDADDLLRVDEHLAGCDFCRDYAASFDDTERRVASVAAADRLAAAAAAGDVPWGATRWLSDAAAVLIAGTAVWRISQSSRQAPPSPAQVVSPNTVAGPKEPALDALTESERAIVERAVTTGELPRAEVLAALNPPPSVLMGSPQAAPSFATVRPAGVVVDEDRPTFEWTPAGSAAEYRVAIFDPMFNKVAESPWLRDTTGWTPDRPLPRGATFAWQVVAKVGGRDITVPSPPRREARFQITSADDHHQLANLRTRIGDSPLTLAVLLADAGLLDDAAQALARAHAADPTSAAVTRLDASLAALRQ